MEENLKKYSVGLLLNLILLKANSITEEEYNKIKNDLEERYKIKH